MRIAYLCADPGVPVFGTKGSSVHVRGVLGALLRRGDIEVELFAMRRGGEAPAELRDIPFHQLGRPTTRETAPRERELSAIDEQTAEQLRAAGPFDAVYERHALWSMAGMAYAAEARIPGILEVNAPLVKEQATYRALVDASGAASAASRAFADATKLVAVSAPLAEWLRTTVRQDDGKVVVLRNGVDLGRFPAPSARRPGAFTVAFVGTLKPWHGLDVLAGAFAALRTDVPDARLLVIGDGPGREGLAGELERLGVSAAVDWKGAVAPETVGTLLASAHATIAPYPAEGDAYFSPLKIVEGMAAGIPVVASAIGQAGELITDGRTGILCTAGDPAAFAAALTGLADAPDRSRRIGAAARAEVAAHHTWDAVAASIVDLMHEGVFA